MAVHATKDQDWPEIAILKKQVDLAVKLWQKLVWVSICVFYAKNEVPIVSELPCFVPWWAQPLQILAMPLGRISRNCPRFRASNRTLTMHAHIQIVRTFYNVDVIIMAYGSTPYVGMTPIKLVATLRVYKWHAWNVYVRLVKGLHGPYQAISSASMSNRTINFAGQYRWSTRLRQVTKTGKPSIWFLCGKI